MKAAPLVFLALFLACLPAAGAQDSGPPAPDASAAPADPDAGPTIPATARFREGSAMTGGTADLELSFTLPQGARLPDPAEVQCLGNP